jgi:transcriptional regulator with XRE-family HTH domain
MGVGERSGWFSEDVATLGDRISASREAAGLSQDQVGRQLGVRARTVAEWENDQSEPRPNRLHLLCGVLGVPLMWLMTGKGDGVPEPGPSGRRLGDAPALAADLRGIRREMAGLCSRIDRLERRLRAAETAGAR